MDESEHLVVYGARKCVWCSKLLDILRGLEIEFTKVSVRQNEDALRFLGSQGLHTVPQVFKMDGTHIGGYEDTVNYLLMKGVLKGAFNE